MHLLYVFPETLPSIASPQPSMQLNGLLLLVLHLEVVVVLGEFLLLARLPLLLLLLVLQLLLVLPGMNIEPDRADAGGVGGEFRVKFRSPDKYAQSWCRWKIGLIY